MRITRVEKLTDEKWLNLFAAAYEHNGHVGRWVFASRKAKPHQGLSGDAVIIVPILRNYRRLPKLVLIKEYRVPVGGYVIGLPAGLCEVGEPMEETIRREMHEETGLKLVTVHRVTQPLLSTAGLSDEAVAMAFVDVKGKVSPNLEASEDIEVMLLDYKGVCALCDDKEAVIDAKLWMVLNMYRMLGKLE